MTRESQCNNLSNLIIIGKAPTCESSFVEGARSIFSLMTNISDIFPHIALIIEFEEANIEIAWMTWINLLLFKAKKENLIFSSFELKKIDHIWRAQVMGEVWRQDIQCRFSAFDLNVSHFSVKQINKIWESRCKIIVDKSKKRFIQLS